MSRPQSSRVVLIGVGCVSSHTATDVPRNGSLTPALQSYATGCRGASCSGKTTLARHLASILPQCYLVHQDDYAPPEELVPIHPEHKVRDWDAAATALEWPRYIHDLQAVKQGEPVDESRRSHEHLNLLTHVPVRQDVASYWKTQFSSSPHALETKYVLVEGFLPFWHPAASEKLDIRLLVRANKDTIRQRRLERNERISEDSFWKDPPGCFDNIVWPAYQEAHLKLFENGAVERGSIRKEMNITVLESSTADMTEMVDTACRRILEHAT